MAYGSLRNFCGLKAQFHCLRIKFPVRCVNRKPNRLIINSNAFADSWSRITLYIGHAVLL